MAHRIWHDVQTAKKGRKVISGSFAPAGAGAITALKGAGAISAARFGVGQFFVVLPASMVVESVTLSLQLAAVADRFIVVDSVTAATNAFAIRVIDGANVAQEIAADANNRIHFTVVARNN
jgi:hypothetical protein